MRKVIFSLSCLTGACAVAALFAAACSDDTTATPPAADAAPVVTPDAANPPSDAAADAPPPPPPGVLHAVIELLPQPPAPDASAPFLSGAHFADYPGAAAAGAWGVKPPKFTIPSVVAGLGCNTSIFNASNPPPSAPDEGDLTLKGFTGGVYINPVDGGVTPFAPPATCTRAQSPATGLFGYVCPFGGAVMSDFLDKADQLNLSAAGGADVDTWSIDAKAPAYGALNVSTNLSGFGPTDFDGSKDLTVNFDCDGAACTQATLLTVSIETTDNPTQANPYDFPAPVAESGLASCSSLAATAGTTYTIPKAVLNALPKSFKFARVTAMVGNAGQATTATKKLPIVFFTGFGRFGVSNVSP